MDISKYVRKSVLNLNPYSSAREEFTKSGDLVFLDANENSYDLHSEENLNRYPDPNQVDLKEKISALKNVPVESIFLGNGSDDIIGLLFLCCCDANISNIITTPPTFGMYGVCADIHAAKNNEVPLNDDFSFNLDNVLAAIDQNTRFIFICSPNNPTGNSVEREKIIELCKYTSEKTNALIVIDEAYIEFSDKKSLINEISNYENLIVTQTFSKAWALAGVRLGCAYAHPEIVNFLNKIKMPYNLNRLTLKAIAKALDVKVKVDEAIATILNEKTILEEFLRKQNYVQKVYSTDTNFIFLSVNDSASLYEYLAELGIIVRNVSRYLNCENHLRVTVGSPEENQKLLNALGNYNA